MADTYDHAVTIARDYPVTVTITRDYAVSVAITTDIPIALTVAVTPIPVMGPAFSRAFSPTAFAVEQP